ncbi:peptidyl-dipeptidase Dcp [Catalinimonas alkaloidigena]|uniref:Peptidyl-dipeptidase Dcp n=1 Tax=Catalinimonas alkaloidigena TaxID=1075417 RepID=A0A1G9HEC5_9BACT|nr:M3 family metallopeptidase [Catalinimonas alkaloidigena]SDL11212.1 peptidyl-dipeptidase Dcp [Catalinimonas alkaloidigena]
MNNILATPFETPFGVAPFSSIKVDDFLPALKAAIEEGKAQVQMVADANTPPTFANTVEALERSGERVGIISSILFNLNAAETNPELQKVARDASPLLSEYGNDILLNEKLFQRIAQVWNDRAQYDLTPEAATLLEKTYKQFVRNGANLDEAGKQRLREIDKRMAELSLLFGEHVLNATNAYEMVITDEAELAGLPEDAREMAADTAREKGKEGCWIFTLQFPSYLPFMTYADHRGRREELFRAYASRSFGGENDNQEVIKELVALRQERAQLLGYASHADFVLEERMAESPQKVYDFLEEMLQYAKPVALREVQDLEAYARAHGGPERLERWDHAYWAEKLKKEKFEIDDEILKPYFQLENVIEGAFQVAGKLYGLTFRQVDNIPVYHPDVRTFVVEEKGTGRHIGVFYGDFFPRPGKRNGAWMTSYRDQKKEKGQEQRPHISIVCNFTKPTATKPSLLTFNEVTTLFHEFGHALHGLLADGMYASLTGTSVYWDFVELPSQVMENWVYEKEALDLFARHYQTGEPIPAELVERIKASANFMSGYQTVRQISFAKLDLAYHRQQADSIQEVSGFEAIALAETELYPKVEGTNTSCSFSHIFQGGYSAGYYSYKWAEVLDADAFEFFQEKGIFNQETADLFRRHVLSAGGSEHPMLLYKRFRGQEPSPRALLRRAGLLPNEETPLPQQ